MNCKLFLLIPTETAKINKTRRDINKYLLRVQRNLLHST